MGLEFISASEDVIVDLSEAYCRLKLIIHVMSAHMHAELVSFTTHQQMGWKDIICINRR